MVSFSKLFYFFLILTFICSACHQDTEEDGQSILLPFNQRIQVTNVTIHGDIVPFTSLGTIMSNHQENINWYSNGVTLSAGTKYTFYFSVNNNQNNILLWSGKKRNLEFHNPGNEFQTMAKQQPLKISINVQSAGLYPILVNVETMEYIIKDPGNNVTNENSLSSAQFLSTHFADNSGWDINLPQNNMEKISPTLYKMSLSNLIPGSTLYFKFGRNENTNEMMSKNPNNSFTYNNYLLDSEVDQLGSNQKLSLQISSENAEIFYSPETQSFLVNTSSVPIHGDGYFSSEFYGPAVLTTTNTNAAIQKIYARDYGNSWYFAVDGSFTNGIGLETTGGVECVMFIDNPSVVTGVTGSYVLYLDMSPVVIPVGYSVEYIIVMEATTSGKHSFDNVYALRNSAKIYGPLTNGMPFGDFLATEKRLAHAFNEYPYNFYGYFSYGNIYELVIPKRIMDANNNVRDIFPVDDFNISVISWSSHTNWGNTSNTNQSYPIAAAMPPSISSNELATVGWAYKD